MSQMPQAVWKCGNVKVSSGFSTEKRGRSKSGQRRKFSGQWQRWLSRCCCQKPLAPRSRNGEHHSHGHGLFSLGFSSIEIPKVAIVWHAERDGFGGVDGTAAANGGRKSYFSRRTIAMPSRTRPSSGFGLTPPSSPSRVEDFGERFFNTGEGRF